MKLNKRHVLAALLVLVMSHSAFSTRKKCTADKILYNGKVFTSNPEAPFTQALAIKGNFIIRTGSNAEVLELQGSETQLINLKEHTVIPGINDAHIHLAPFNANGIYLNNPNDFIPGRGPSLGEFLALIGGADQQVPPEVWFYLIVGEEVLEDPDATRFALDTAAPDRPVIMLGWTGHQMHINTAAMQALGIQEDQPDPFGGSYERLANSNIINGVLQEYAIYDLARRMRMNLPPELVSAQLSAMGDQLVQSGITSIQDMGIGFTAERYADILEAANLPLRVRNIPFPLSVEESRALYQNDSRPINPFDKVITSGVKWVADGTQVERGSAFEEPYYDYPIWSGVSNFMPADLNAMIADSLGSYCFIKHQRLVHATGDRTVSDLLAAMNLAGTDSSWKHRRFRIEHGDMIQPVHMDELASKGVVVVQNPTHFGLPATMFSRVGPVRFATLQPLRSLIDAGIPVALGSDALGTPPNPYLDIMLAVLHPTNSDEAISLPEAVVAYTAGGAYAEFMGHLKGTLKKGQLADIAVLSLDIFNPGNGELLPSTTSILTIVDGEIVWDAECLDIAE